MKDAFTPMSSADGLPVSLKASPYVSNWINIGATDDGHIEIFSGKVELGQGILTAIAQIAADELRVPLSQIKMVGARTGRSPDESMTSNSLSIQHSGMSVRAVCRQVRHMFAQAVEEKHHLKDHTVVARRGGFYAGDQYYGSYQNLSPLVDLNVRVAPQDTSGSDSSTDVLVGKDQISFGMAEKAGGRYGFIHNMPMQGGLHASMLRPPSINARLRSLDTSSLDMNGIFKIVRDGSLVGVLAEKEHIAQHTVVQLAAMAVWEEFESLPEQGQLGAWLRSRPCATTVQTKKVPDQAVSGGIAKTYAADYLKPFIKHASIGPSCAYARYDENKKMQVWTHSQGIYNLRADLALAFSMEPDDVVVAHVPGSGCYGHNGADDAAFDAAWMSRHAEGRLVRVQWSRADELCWSPQGPAMSIHLEADVDASGAILDWRHTVWGPGHSLRPGRAATPAVLGTWYLENPSPVLSAINAPVAVGGGTERNIEPLYAINCSALTCHRVVDMPIRTSSLRCLGAFANVFAIESLIDDIATDHGIDPIDYRIGMLTDERAIEALAVVRKISGWNERQAAREDGATTGFGIGFARYKNKSTYCAVVAEVEVTHEVKVKQLFIAVDVGEVINPLGVIQQIEGGAIQATSWATIEAARFSSKGLIDDDWEKYPIIRFSQVPRIQVKIIPRPTQPPLGCGEAALAPTAAAIGNAVRNALGVRVRNLPLNFQEISRAIEVAA